MSKTNCLWTLNNGWVDTTIYPEPTYTTQIDDNLVYPDGVLEFQDEMGNTVKVNI